MHKRVLNFFAGPGTGKSTTATALFAELKYQGFNTEYIPEYAKDASWEQRGPQVFSSQEYIFGKQHFRQSRVVWQVEFLLTDSPILQSIAYIPEDFDVPSLKKTIREYHNRYDNINIFLERSSSKAYNPKGRNQTEEEARIKDAQIRDLLDSQQLNYQVLPFGRQNVWEVIDLMFTHGWLTDPERFLQGAENALASAARGVEIAVKRRELMTGEKTRYIVT